MPGRDYQRFINEATETLEGVKRKPSPKVQKIRQLLDEGVEPTEAYKYASNPKGKKPKGSSNPYGADAQKTKLDKEIKQQQRQQRNV